MRRNSHAEVDPKMGAYDGLVTSPQPTEHSLPVVVEAPLHDVVLYASTPTVIEGITYDIPIIIHACIDVLRRTGLWTVFIAVASK
jgi:hypothetical protein